LPTLNWVGTAAVGSGGVTPRHYLYFFFRQFATASTLGHKLFKEYRKFARIAFGSLKSKKLRAARETHKGYKTYNEKTLPLGKCAIKKQTEQNPAK